MNRWGRSRTKTGRGNRKVDNSLRKPHNLMRKTVGFSRKEDAFSGPMLKIDAPVGGSVMHLGTSRRFVSRTRHACSRASLSKGHLFTDRRWCCSGLDVKNCPRFFLHPLCDRPHPVARLGHACLRRKSRGERHDASPFSPSRTVAKSCGKTHGLFVDDGFIKGVK